MTTIAGLDHPASDALEQLRQLAGTGKTPTDERRTVVAAVLRY